MSETTPPSIPLTASRLTSLDGLRGIAAVIVVFHHSLLTITALSVHYVQSTAGPHTQNWWLLFSPAHILWGGTEAVYLFFVLSGIVLVRAVNSARFRWDAYFPSRLVRLYGPVIVVVILVVILVHFVPRAGNPAGTWLGNHSNYSIARFLQDVTLLTGTSGVNTPLWSLQWEVLFSLLLPVAVLLGRFRHAWITIAVCIAVCTIGFQSGVLILEFLPMFGIGAALSGNWDRVAALAQRVSRIRIGHGVWVVITVVALLLVGIYWEVLPFYPGSATFVLTRPITLVGVTLIVLAAAFWSAFRAFLDTRIVQWLGRISFSLYLVHEPIVVSAALLTNSSPWAIPVAIAISVGIAAAFYYLIERPFHRLSQRIKNSKTSIVL